MSDLDAALAAIDDEALERMWREVVRKDAARRAALLPARLQVASRGLWWRVYRRPEP